MKEYYKAAIDKSKVYEKPVQIDPEETMVDEFNRGGKDSSFFGMQLQHICLDKGEAGLQKRRAPPSTCYYAHRRCTSIFKGHAVCATDLDSSSRNGSAHKIS